MPPIKRERPESMDASAGTFAIKRERFDHDDANITKKRAPSPKLEPSSSPSPDKDGDDDSDSSGYSYEHDDTDYIYYVWKKTEINQKDIGEVIKDESLLAVYATLKEANKRADTELEDQLGNFEYWEVQEAGSDGEFAMVCTVRRGDWDEGTVSEDLIVVPRQHKWNEPPPKGADTGEVWVMTEEGENVGCCNSRVGAVKALERWLEDKKDDDPEGSYRLTKDKLTGQRLTGENGEWIKEDIIKAVLWKVTC